MRPLLLDLYCGAGGAGAGYHAAGFDVLGVDLAPQPRYPFAFVRADALEVLAGDVIDLEPFAAVHASPPCQAHSALRTRHPGRAYPDLVAATREALEALGRPYVIENVPGAPLRDAVTLCGSSFGLGAGGRQLRRHRLFETTFPVMRAPCQHRGQALGVYGNGGGVGSPAKGYTGSKAEWAEALGITWATKAELAQAIPPAYTAHVGRYLLGALNGHR